MPLPAPPPLARLRQGPGHPLFLGALALLLANDHVLKARHPGPWITGKLSDLAFLVVAPVLLGALLAALPPAWLGAPAGRTKRLKALAIGVPAVVFAALQLWPPLGEAGAALLGGAHVADPADLLALPALALVPRCWRPHRRGLGRGGRRVAGLVGALGLLATSYAPDRRSPCDGDDAWDPARPLALSWSSQTLPDNLPLLETGLRLRDAAGADVPFTLHRVGSAGLLLCPTGGLAPGATYVWDVGGWEDPGLHVRGVPAFGATGRRTFTTAPTAAWTRGCAGATAIGPFVESCGADTGAAETGALR